ncbi:hypothetical protein BGZ63DRAFT_428304 [Mariannaea sp. PMI_226]|nr:hypothetical protein BGZ63DRAFT_428304 [Mariannaea sp. PMI_226]
MPSFLISNARVFDGESVIHTSGHVLVVDGSIKLVSATKPTATPRDCTILDGLGCTVLPGLIDAHVHAYHDVDFLEKAIQYGVTTVIDLHNEPHWFRDLKAIAAERDDVSDIISVCYAATIKNGWPSAIVTLSSPDPDVLNRISDWPNIIDAASAEEYVAKNIAAGASYIKLMQESGDGIALPFPTRPVPTPSLQIQKSIVDSAHRHGLLTFAHAVSCSDTLRMLEAGVDGLAHVCNEPLNLDALDAFNRIKPFVIPTLAIHASASGEEQSSRERFADGLDNGEREHMCSCLNISREGFTLQNACENVKVLRDAGIEIVCGTDSSKHLNGVMAGASLLHELWLYVNRCNFTPLEALKSATSVTARRLKLTDRGRIQEGLKADLVLVKGDPTTSIDCVTDIVTVWRNGQRVK